MAAVSELALRPRILVITLRRLGDVLLTTPLTRSLKLARPDARIDMLVFAGTEGILSGNPDLDRVLTMPPRASAAQTLALIRRIGRRYDLAVCTQTGDRPALLAFAAGRRRIGLTPPRGPGGWWKRLALGGGVTADPGNHRLTETLRLASALGIEPHAEVVCPAIAMADRIPGGRYAVVHAEPMFRYRRWSDESWRSLVRALAARGLTVVATGGPGAREKAYLDGLWNGADTPVARLDGALEWPQLTALLKGAALYIGADTSVTHLAAAAGCPTVALFGPTDPRLWGPWPAGGLAEMWHASGTIQRRGNVRLVQHMLPCLPCQKEGCERHVDSHSACLDRLSVAQVLEAADEALMPAELPRRRAANG